MSLQIYHLHYKMLKTNILKFIFTVKAKSSFDISAQVTASLQSLLSLSRLLRTSIAIILRFFNWRDNDVHMQEKLHFDPSKPWINITGS